MPSFLQRFVATFGGSLNGKLKTKPETGQGRARQEQNNLKFPSETSGFAVSDGNPNGTKKRWPALQKPQD